MGSRESLSTNGLNATIITYDFLFRPPTGILNSTKPLLPKSEMILTLDRAYGDIALINKGDLTDDGYDGKVMPLKNVFLSAKYCSSPYLRNYFDSMSTKEVPYIYDECSVYNKNLPTDDIDFEHVSGIRWPSK